jgi:hypothetical protein
MTYDDEFDGETFRENPLTAFQQAAVRKRGRPKSLRDEELWGMRASVLDTIDRFWAQVGWELGKAKTVQQLRSAFQPISGSSGQLQFFVRSSISQATPGSARMTQKKLGLLIARSRSSYEHQCKLQERLDRAKNALPQATSDSQKAEIERLCRERQVNLQSFTAEYEKLQRDERELNDQLIDQLAYIAQHELLSFIRSRRYSFNPVNLANAMAGLPTMGWRQSFKRCLNLKERVTLGFEYRSVQLIDQVRKKSSRRNLVSALATELCSQPKASFAQDMKKNWYYLRSAIEESVQQKMHPGAIPYRIFAEYRRKMSSRSAIDWLLEEEQQLS